MVPAIVAPEKHCLTDCAFDGLHVVTLPPGGKPVANVNYSKGGMVADGGGCPVVKTGYTCSPLMCVQGEFQKPECAAKGRLFFH